jgi:hypothetical protein
LRTGKQVPAMPIAQFKVQLLKVIADKAKDFDI